MRDLLIYPDFNMQAKGELCEVLVSFKRKFETHPWDIGESEAWIVVEQAGMLLALEKLYALIGKKVTLSRLLGLMQRYSVDVASVLLLQERAPAVFDMTFDEVVDVLSIMYQQEVPVYQQIYYQELLQKSLLLTQIESDLPSIAEGETLRLSAADIEGLARVLMAKSQDASEIIVQ